MAMAMMSLMRVMMSMMMMTNPHAHLVNLLGQSDARRVHGDADKRLVSMSCNKSEFKMGSLKRSFTCSQKLPHTENVIVKKKFYVLPQKCWPAYTSSPPKKHDDHRSRYFLTGTRPQ